MLRIFLWRFIFECLNLLKILGYRGSTRYYFAFGANLDRRVMEHRRMSVRAVEPAYLENYKMKFCHALPFQGAATASIQEEANAKVPGALYSIPKIDEWRMDCFEGHLVFGRHKKGHALVNGKNCFFYFSARPAENLVPSREYLEKIVAGYRAFFPDDQIFLAQLENQKCVENLVLQSPPQFLIRNYDALGSFFRPLLERYDALCVRVFLFFIFRPSIFKHWVPTT